MYIFIGFQYFEHSHNTHPNAILQHGSSSSAAEKTSIVYHDNHHSLSASSSQEISPANPPVGDNDHQNEATEKKRKQRRPKACTTCGHLVRAFPAYHIDYNLVQNKHKSCSSCACSRISIGGCNSNSATCSSITGDDATKEKRCSSPCSNPNPLPTGEKYRAGQCFYSCPVCEEFLLEKLNEKSTPKKRKS